jgi:hypothetical protein
MLVMAQLFTSRATTVFRVALTLAPVALVAAGVLAYGWARSGSAWGIGRPAPQPVPFRHDLHAGSLGLDCRHCHAEVERAASAGMPSAQTCMSCHAQVLYGASVLQPVRTALALDEPIVWRSVSRVPDHAYFHHGAHVAAGVGCETCHGRVDRMPRTVRAESLSMGFCLDCHRDPVPRLRPKEDVFAFGRAPGRADLPRETQALYHAAVPRLTSCSTCHR